jgi:hypothetical protein
MYSYGKKTVRPSNWNFMPLSQQENPTDLSAIPLKVKIYLYKFRTDTLLLVAAHYRNKDMVIPFAFA